MSSYIVGLSQSFTTYVMIQAARSKLITPNMHTNH